MVLGERKQSPARALSILNREFSTLWDFRDRIAATPVILGQVVAHVTISAGVARRQPDQCFEDLYRAADRALYLAKAAGRNQVVLDSPLATPSLSTEKQAHHFNGRIGSLGISK